MSIRAVIFDRDGVLSNFDFKTIIAFFSPSLPISLNEIGERLRQWGLNTGFPKNSEEERAFWYSFCQQLSQELNLSSTICARLQNFNYLEYIYPFPDAKPALSYIGDRGLKIGVISNNPMSGIYSSLEIMGLANLIDAVCATQIDGFVKPHPQAYLGVTNILNVKPEECLYFDDEEACVQGAAALGMKAYLVNRDHTTDKLYEKIVSNLTVVPQILNNYT